MEIIDIKSLNLKSPNEEDNNISSNQKDNVQDKVDLTEEILKKEFAPKKKFTLKDIKTYTPKRKEIIGEHKYLSDYYNKSGKIDYIKLSLSKTGVMYRLNNYDLNPFIFYGCIFGASFIVSIIAGIISHYMILIPILTIMLIIGAVFTIQSSNDSDNKQMLMDICNVYTIFNTDVSNGVYLSDCLSHMQDVISNKRLKYALEELILNIKDSKTTIDESLILFTNRFNSQEIQVLSGMLKQFITSGVNDEFKNDVNKQTAKIISDVNNGNSTQAIATSRLIGNMFTLVMFIALGYYIYMNIKAGIRPF